MGEQRRRDRDERWGSGGVRRPIPLHKVRGETGEKKKKKRRSDQEKGKEGEESAGHGALCCSPHLSLPG